MYIYAHLLKGTYNAGNFDQFSSSGKLTEWTHFILGWCPESALGYDFNTVEFSNETLLKYLHILLLFPASTT